MSEKLKNRLKNYSFWVSLASAILLLVQAVGKPLGLVINEELYMSIVNSVLGVFVVLGIISHPAQNLVKDTANLNENDTNNEVVNTENNNLSGSGSTNANSVSTQIEKTEKTLTNTINSTNEMGACFADVVKIDNNSGVEISTANAKVANTNDFSADVENSAKNSANLCTTQTGTSAAQVENSTTLQTANTSVTQAKNGTMQVQNASTMQTKSAENCGKNAVNSNNLQNSSTFGLMDSVLPFGKTGKNLSLAEQTDNKSNSANSAHNIDVTKTADMRTINELKAEILKSIK